MIRYLTAEPSYPHGSIDKTPAPAVTGPGRGRLGGVDVLKRTESRTHHRAVIPHTRRGYRQDPAARALVEHVDPDSFGFFPAMAELMKLKGYGIEITPEIAAKVGEKYARWLPGKPTDPEYMAAQGSVVYYIRIGNRAKIGTSTNFAQRCASLNPEEVLAVEPGGVTLERARHGEFAHLRTHGEWFRYEGSLVEHVESIRRATDDRPRSRPPVRR